MNTVDTHNFIWLKNNSLSASFCQHMIDRFESDPFKSEGVLGIDRRVDKEFKQTTEIPISIRSGWKLEDNIFFESLQQGLKEYRLYLSTIRGITFPVDYKLNDTGYLVQRYEPGGFFDWHSDWSMSLLSERVYTFIWYLNTIHSPDGGYTEFGDGTKIQPKEGMLLLFPATWTYLHRGFPPKIRKYICTGWVHANKQ